MLKRCFRPASRPAIRFAREPAPPAGTSTCVQLLSEQTHGPHLSRKGPIMHAVPPLLARGKHGVQTRTRRVKSRVRGQPSNSNSLPPSRQQACKFKYVTLKESCT